MFFDPVRLLYVTVLRGRHRDELEALEAEVAVLRGQLDTAREQVDDAHDEKHYWQDMYRVMVRIIAAQHDDPAFAWLDEIVRYRAAVQYPRGS